MPRVEGSAPGGSGAEEDPKVLYVIGAGRSGSTILGIALGNCEGVFYAGELDKWLRRSGTPPLGGEERERFWERVREQIDVEDELLGKAARPLEQSMALMRVRTWGLQRRLAGPYRRFSSSLYRTIARTAGATHVVDTSHFPRRARQLQKTPGIELHLLFVVRDPQSVVASWGRDDVIEPQFSVTATNAYLWLTYLLALAVFLRQPRRRRLLVRHEEFLADPEGVIGDILARSGGESPMPDFQALRTGIPFQGNRVAREEVVALSPPSPRKAGRSLATAIVQLPWQAVFALIGPVAGRAGRARPARQRA
jgi:hypothetical protein